MLNFLMQKIYELLQEMGMENGFYDVEENCIYFDFYGNRVKLEITWGD